jgi:hypothetical protein
MRSRPPRDLAHRSRRATRLTLPPNVSCSGRRRRRRRRHRLLRCRRVACRAPSQPAGVRPQRRRRRRRVPVRPTCSPWLLSAAMLRLVSLTLPLDCKDPCPGPSPQQAPLDHPSRHPAPTRRPRLEARPLRANASGPNRPSSGWASAAVGPSLLAAAAAAARQGRSRLTGEGQGAARRSRAVTARAAEGVVTRSRC